MRRRDLKSDNVSTAYEAASKLCDDPRSAGGPLPPVVIDRVVELTLAEPPGEVTHWIGRAMAAASGISLRSVPSKRSIVGTKRSCQTTRPCGCL